MNQLKTNKSGLKFLFLVLFSAIPCLLIAQEKKITIQEKNISLEDVFAQIEKQTGYSIAYDRSKIDVKKKISVSLKDATLDKAFSEVLENTGLSYKINGYHIILVRERKKEPENKKPLTQTIRGTVTETVTGLPLGYANVILVNLPTIGAVTDSLGQFRMNNVPVGRYDIQVTSLGFKPTIYNEILVTSTKQVYLKIPMTEDVQALNEVVVRPQVNKEQPMNPMALTGGRVINMEEASRFAGGFDDPARLVTSFAGVAGNVNTNALAIRGNSPNFTQWRMEGVQIPNPTHYADMTGLGGGLLTGLSTNVIGNSDFYNGAYSAEYDNALSGVFDMFMRTGNYENFEHSFEVGVWGLDVASEGPISKKNKSSYLINYRYSFSGISDAISGANEGLNYQDLSFRLNFPTKKAGTFSLWGIGLKDKFLQKYEEDASKWESIADKQETTNYFTKGTLGLGHKIFLKNDAYLKTTLATSYAGVEAYVDQVDDNKKFYQMADIKNKESNFILSSYLNKKINSKHTNRTGITVTGIDYNFDYKLTPEASKYEPINTISEGSGFKVAFSAFSSSIFYLNKYFDASLGIAGQYFTLNNHWTVEPRAALKWKISPGQSLALAYGLNTSRDRMEYYYVKTPGTGDKLINKDLDFSKSHHISLSFNKRISDNFNLKIEPYFQYLYDIPVESGTSFSILNHNGFALDKKLVNAGNGRNYGVDVTLERYLNNGWYGMFTGSLFKSEYLGGDNAWRNTRMDREFILNLLAGKEWVFRQQKNKTFSANIRLSYQGGDRYTPIDEATSLEEHTLKYDESKAYSLQLPNSFTSDITLRYRINKKKISHEFSFMILNANGFRQTGYRYNLITNSIETVKGAPIVPSISYKIYF